MIIFMFNMVWFVATLACTYFAAVTISVAFDHRYGDKRFTIVAVLTTSVTFVSWYGLYSSITQGIN
jgi:hypothetical protein